MKHFKNGADVVVVEEVADFRVGDTHTVDYVDRYGRVWLDCGGWLQAKRLRLVEQDDPLPPAPESVRYNDEYPNRSAYKQTWLDVKQDDNQVYIETGQYGESKGVGMVLSADAALQLAHDLTRMAMEIKRKEKHNA